MFCPGPQSGFGRDFRYQANKAWPPQTPFTIQVNPCLPTKQSRQSFSTTTIFGTISRKMSLSLSFGSKPSFFSAVSEMYRPIVPQARTPMPMVRRVRGERLRKDLVGVSDVSCGVGGGWEDREDGQEG